ncbi:hypothetical protein F2Q69_00031855 [Brassica cretica]|uniref:Uncharacterized protein n=1 Tax=Brassica cretica TaxID=69181 RepID=A0A8S9S1A1_BRACR|nr:hypothetical protein F2Q69_00031855 [Brassica cretica]
MSEAVRSKRETELHSSRRRVMRNKYIVAHQELDDDHEVSDLFLDPDVLFRLEELEHEKGVKHAV